MPSDIDPTGTYDALSFDELLEAAENLEARIDYANPSPGELEQLSVLHELTMDRQPWTLYQTCTGSPVLLVQANPIIANAVAHARGLDLSSTCQQCGDTNYVEVEPSNGVRPEVDCEVVTATQIDAMFPDEGDATS